MISIGLIMAISALLIVIYFSFLSPNLQEKTTKLVTGEWAPYTGEKLPANGIVTAIVTHILVQMGYSVEYEFMPWSLGEARVANSQRNDDIRGIFPYIKTKQREKNFYFSRSIMNIEYAAFYHRDKNPGAAIINEPGDLSAFRILALDGYEYHSDIKPYLPEEPCRKRDTEDAFLHLAEPKPMTFLASKLIKPKDIENSQKSGKNPNHPPSSPVVIKKLRFSRTLLPSGAKYQDEYFVYYLGKSPRTKSGLLNEGDLKNHDILVVKGEIQQSLINAIDGNVCIVSSTDMALQTLIDGRKPPIVIEAVEVGHQLLSQRLPNLLPEITQTEHSIKVPHAIMFSRNNPNNLNLRNEFDRYLTQLQNNSNAYQKIIDNAKKSIEMTRAVELKPFSSQGLVAAFFYDRLSHQCKKEQLVYLPNGSKAVVTEWHDIFLHYQQRLEDPLVKIKLLNGPLASRNQSLCVDARVVKLP